MPNPPWLRIRNQRSAFLDRLDAERAAARYEPDPEAPPYVPPPVGTMATPHEEEPDDLTPVLPCVPNDGMRSSWNHQIGARELPEDFQLQSDGQPSRRLRGIQLMSQAKSRHNAIITGEVPGEPVYIADEVGDRVTQPGANKTGRHE